MYMYFCQFVKKSSLYVCVCPPGEREGGRGREGAKERNIERGEERERIECEREREGEREGKGRITQPECTTHSM